MTAAQLTQMVKQRRVDMAHQEAWARGMRDVHRRLGDIEGHLAEHNYGLASDAATQLREDTSDDLRPPFVYAIHRDILVPRAVEA